MALTTYINYDFYELDRFLKALNSFNIYSYDQLNITAGSVIITLEDNQKMKLLDLSPNDVSANNFVFAPEPINDDGGSSSGLSLGVVAGLAIGGIALIGGIGYGVYAYINKLWPFIVSATTDITKSIELGEVGSAVIEEVNNPVVGEVVKAVAEEMA